MSQNKKEESDYSHVAGVGFFPHEASSSGASIVDDIMHPYMQQCLEYHDQQVKPADDVPHFVKSIKVEEEDVRFLGKADEMRVAETEETAESRDPASLPSDDPTKVPHSTKSIKVEDEDDRILERKDEMEFAKLASPVPTDELTKIQEARDRAQAILARFQQHQQKCLSEPTEGTTSNSSVFASVRRISLEKEEERKKRFLEKNFEYITSREQQRMQQQAVELSAAEEWNREYLAILEERQQQRYEAQKQRKEFIATQAGIGTASRSHQVPVARDSQIRKTARSSIAVYVSGFADSSVDEIVLRDLFRHCGNIEKIHIYRDKVQGTIKGDGLIIFEGCQDSDEFLSTVCEQMNGVELPSGTILQVEPSLSNKRTKAKSISVPQCNPLRESPKPEVKANISNDDGDLDDFFASL